MKKVSIVLSCFNEENCIKLFFEKMVSSLPSNFNYEIIYIDDGSIDNTINEIIDIKKQIELNNGRFEINKKIDEKDIENYLNINIKIIKFTKNFGHESAMLCGIDFANGDYIIFMDGDGQHPAECISEILNSFESGNDIILMSRLKNKNAGFIKNVFSIFFYFLINKISDSNFEKNASDYFAINKKVLYFLRENYREKVRFLRGIIQNIGFKKEVLKYSAKNRINGKSKYTIKKLMDFALISIFSYTDAPLQIGLFFGFFSGFMGVILTIYTLITRKGAPSGYATIIIFLCFMFAMLFLVIGIIGEYLSIIFKEIKDRPNYIVEDIL